MCEGLKVTDPVTRRRKNAVQARSCENCWRSSAATKTGRSRERRLLRS